MAIERPNLGYHGIGEINSRVYRMSSQCCFLPPFNKIWRKKKSADNPKGHSLYQVNLGLAMNKKNPKE